VKTYNGLDAGYYGTHDGGVVRVRMGVVWWGGRVVCRLRGL